MTAADFQRYIDAFNRGDYAGCREFYAPDVVLVQAGGRRLEGPAAIVAFYESLAGKLARQIAVRRVIPGDDALAAELESTFTALQDLPDVLSVPLKAGQSHHHVSFAIYELRRGRFTRIRAALYRGG